MSPYSKVQQLSGLLVSLLLCFAAAGLGALASLQADTFYASLNRPAWAPPGWLFGPVWSALYFLMAIAAWWVWRIAAFALVRAKLVVFVVQLVFNTLWSWLFFAAHWGQWAFADIVILWVLIVVTLLMFWRTSRFAGALLIPYLLWVSFAAALNYSVWQLNSSVLG